MQVIKLNQESIDIEIQGVTYTLSGGIRLEGGFDAWASQTVIHGTEEVPMSMSYRRRLAEQYRGGAVPEEWLQKLLDSNIVIPSEYVEIGDKEKTEVMGCICKDLEADYPIYFLDDNGAFLCRTATGIYRQGEWQIKFSHIERKSIDVETHGRVARFRGEICRAGDGFDAVKGTMEWLSPERRPATEEERAVFIREVKSVWRKSLRKEKKKFQVHFCDKISKSLKISTLENPFMDIEMDNRVARFRGRQIRHGEFPPGVVAGFQAAADTMEWLSPEKRPATEEERNAFIQEVRRLYRKKPRRERKRFTLLFRDAKGRKKPVKHNCLSG